MFWFVSWRACLSFADLPVCLPVLFVSWCVVLCVCLCYFRLFLGRLSCVVCCLCVSVVAVLLILWVCFLGSSRTVSLRVYYFGSVLTSSFCSRYFFYDTYI